jgi:hypothetical protein
VGSFFQNLSHHIQWWVAVRYPAAHGVRVRNGVLGPKAQPAFRPLAAGIEFLAQAKPRWAVRTRRDATGILVAQLSMSDAQFWPEGRFIVVDLGFLSGERAAPIAVALALVHEAAHARLFRRYVPYTERNYLRVERACVRQQVAFLAGLPPTPATALLLTHYREVQDSVATHWGPEASDSRFRAAIDQLEVPEWFRRFLRGRLAARRRRHDAA